MSYKVASPQIGWPQIGDVDTTPKVPVGTRCSIQDLDLTVPQAGEAVYLKSTDAITLGALVAYDQQLATCVLGPATGGVGPVAVSFGIVATGRYAWFQIAGNAKVLAPNAVAAGANVFPLAATPGSVDDAAVAGEQILGAKFSTTTPVPAAGFAWMTIDRPLYQGQIT
jgi:hypothetical protein